MAHSTNRVTVHIRSKDPIIWLDVWPGSCDVRVFPDSALIERLDLKEMALLHAALGYILTAGPKLTAEGMAKAVASFVEPS